MQTNSYWIIVQIEDMTFFLAMICQRTSTTTITSTVLEIYIIELKHISAFKLRKLTFEAILKQNGVYDPG